MATLRLTYVDTFNLNPCPTIYKHTNSLLNSRCSDIHFYYVHKIWMNLALSTFFPFPWRRGDWSKFWVSLVLDENVSTSWTLLNKTCVFHNFHLIRVETEFYTVQCTDSMSIIKSTSWCSGQCSVGKGNFWGLGRIKGLFSLER